MGGPAAVALLGLCCAAFAEQLPIKAYSTADGLPRNLINRIVTDRRGFLWFCTPEGLSRFDGYQFTNYGSAEGLPDPDVSDLLIRRDGEYWVATRKGVCLFRPDGLQSSRPRFTVYRPDSGIFSQRIRALADDGAGGLWCATFDGLYHLVRDRGEPRLQFVDLGMDPGLDPSDRAVAPLLVDRSGSLWIGSGLGLYRRAANGGVGHFTARHGLPSPLVMALLEDRQGRLWAGTAAGLCLLVPRPDPSARAVARVFTTRDGLPHDRITALAQGSDGGLWIGTPGGVSRLEETGPDDRPRCLSFDASSGLPSPDVGSLSEDQEGNLWVGAGGAAKVARHGFVTYTGADGLRGLSITSIFETRSGELCVTDQANRRWIHRFDGRRFVAIRVRYPDWVSYLSWGWNQHLVEDHEGNWWLPSGAGVWRFPPVPSVTELAAVLPKARYGTREGLPYEDVFRVFEDSRGDVWVSALGPKTCLAKWERRTGKIVRYPEVEGPATAFREDRAGNLWIGFYLGGVARLREGSFKSFGAAEGVPAGMILELYLDQTGRLWVAGFRGGLARVDDPAAAQPRFQLLTTDQGLSSNSAKCVTEDRWGRIYVGTGRGVDRLDPKTGRIRHFTTADGLAPGEPTAAFRSRDGALWFGTGQGLSRLVVEPDRAPSPPPVFITEIQAGGVDLPVSDLGETHFETRALKATQNQLQIGFVGLSFAPGEKLRYQFMLEGIDRDWSAPSDQRRIRYARLSPAAYRFRVRAVNADGVPSREPAVFAFSIDPQLWQRWWFQGCGVILLGLSIYMLHRFRMAQLIALERVRMRIAGDLHDEIGSGLSRVGVLSELVLRQPGVMDPKMTVPLVRIAALSRELCESMSDLVWSVNPGKDRLQDLSQRMRRYASDVFTERQIDLQFSTPSPEADRKLVPELRHQVFLIFKEAVNNAVRHSACSEAAIDLRLEGRELVLEVRDNGKGFRLPEDAPGHGLTSMHRRAHDLGGELKVISEDGRGVTVTLKVPSDRHTSSWRRMLPKLGGRWFGGMV